MKPAFTLLTLLLTLITFSQVRLEGLVKDPSGIALDMANVMAINKETNAMDAYAITDGQGRFRLNLKAGTTYKVKISFIGYQALNEEITMTTENQQKVFTMAEGKELDGVEIVHTMPVSVKGDTIVYDGDSFKTGEERKLEDILKKLPGVEVTADGQVQVEGKNVSKLLVEGKPFFEGDTKLGIKNIPSDAVDKIQVLRNFNEVGQMRGLENNNEDVALNIKLKKGKEKFWFGDVTVGGGTIERKETETGYIANPKLFYYSPKTSINVIGNLNNIGEESFTARDFFRLTGGARNTISRSGTSFNFNRGALGLGNTENVAGVINRFGAANASHQFSKKWNVSGFSAYSSTTTDTETYRQNSIFRPNSTTVATQENRSNFTTLENRSFVAKFGSKYKPSDRFQLDYDVFVRRAAQEEQELTFTNATNFINGNAIINNNSIGSFNSNDPIEFNQSLNVFFTQNAKSTWVLEMQHQYQDEDPFFNPRLENNPFLNIPESVFVNENSLNINQNRFVETNRIDAKLDYYYQINNKSILNITGGNTNAIQTYDSNIFQTLANGQNVEIDRFDYRNDVSYRFNDAFLGVHYKFILGKFTFNPGITFHQYNTINRQNNQDFELNFNRLLPDVFAQWQIKKSESMTYNFRMSNVFNDINSLVQGYTFGSFNSISRGNPLLENALQTSHNLNYFKYNLFNFTTIIGNISYNTTKNPVVSRAFFDGIYQTSERRNLADVDNELLNGFASYSRNFKKYYKATARVNMTWNKFNGLRTNPQSPNDEALDFVQSTENFRHTYTTSFGTQFKKLPNVDLGYTLGFDQGSNNKFTTHSPFVKLNYYFLDGLNINLDYTYNEFINNQNNNSDVFELFSASINYKKKDAKWEYRVQANNLLNTQTRNTSSFNVNGFNANQFVILPRIITFSLRYNL